MSWERDAGFSGYILFLTVCSTTILINNFKIQQTLTSNAGLEIGFNLICSLNLFAKKKLQTNQNIGNLIC